MLSPRAARFWIAPMIMLVFAACSSKRPRDLLLERQNEANPRTATYGSDTFYSDLGTPERPPKPESEFFFKRCSLSGRHPYPSANDWECTEPQ